MEQKIIFRMILVFFIVTGLAVGGLFIVSTNAFSLIPKPAVSPTPSAAPIVISPRPSSVLGETIVSTPTPTPKPQVEKSLALDGTAIYSLINAHRKEKGLSVLRVHPALEQSSQRKIVDMIEKKYWQHENPEGVMDWNVFKQSGYEYSTAGENLSFGNNTPWNVFSAWVESPVHNEQMLNPEYEDMGLALDCGTYQQAGKKSCVVVLHLGKQQL